MKRIIVLLLTVFILCGCSRENSEFDRAMSVRTGIINAQGCSLTAEITADFTDKTYTFKMQCQVDRAGDIEFEVMEPGYLDGIQGTISSDGGKLIFDDTALAFTLQPDGVLSPACAPWILMRTLRGGYVRYCAVEEEYLRMTVDDSYEEDALTLDIWIGANNAPVQADIFQNNVRIMTICITDYRLL